MQSTDQLWPEEKQMLGSWEQKGSGSSREVRQLHKPHALHLNGETISEEQHTKSNIREKYLHSALKSNIGTLIERDSNSISIFYVYLLS